MEIDKIDWTYPDGMDGMKDYILLSKVLKITKWSNKKLEDLIRLGAIRRTEFSEYPNIIYYSESQIITLLKIEKYFTKLK